MSPKRITIGRPFRARYDSVLPEHAVTAPAGEYEVTYNPVARDYTLRGGTHDGPTLRVRVTAEELAILCEAAASGGKI
jgi:hypothetical protein